MEESYNKKLEIKEIDNGFIVNDGESVTVFEKKDIEDDEDREELQTMVNLLKFVCIELGIKLDTRHRLNVDIKITERE